MDNLLFRIEIQGLSDQVRELGRLKSELQDLRNQQKQLNQELKSGKITTDAYNLQIGALNLKMDACTKETANLKKETAAAATVFKGAEGSMVRLSQELANNRDKYRTLSQAERENADVGGKLLTTIHAQDAEIKNLDKLTVKYTL